MLYRYISALISESELFYPILCMCIYISDKSVTLYTFHVLTDNSFVAGQLHFIVQINLIDSISELII